MESTAARYTIISADCHAGGSMDQYAAYLDPAWRDEFDAWRAKYTSPWRDLDDDDGKLRNWDSHRRAAEEEADGVVAGVIFPNTVPPFFPTNAVVAHAPSPRSYPRRLAGVHAHNRWLTDWVAEQPERRRGLIQILLNDIDQAVVDVRRFTGPGMGGILLPGVSPDSGLPPLFAPHYDPLWEVCEELELSVTHHGGGSGMPDLGRHPASMMVFVTEAPWWADRTVWHLIWGGIFERFPRLKFVLTEVGIGFVPELLRRLDYYHDEISTGRLGEIAFEPDQMLAERPSTYFARNCYMGASFPGTSDAEIIREIGIDRVMWGSDYPHNEGTYPYTRESLRRSFAGWTPEELQQLLAGTAAEVYGFDLEALAPLAAAVGPTHEEIAIPLDAAPPDATSPAFMR